MTPSEELDLILELSCSLAKTAEKDSWIEGVGGQLPDYICRIAKHLIEGGSTTSAAIATAVNTVKRWAAGGTSSKSGPRAKKVHGDTQAKAAKALAEWEALKAKAHVKASHSMEERFTLSLSALTLEAKDAQEESSENSYTALFSKIDETPTSQLSEEEAQSEITRLSHLLV